MMHQRHAARTTIVSIASLLRSTECYVRAAMTRLLLVLAIVAGAPVNAHAAPWSFELPEGYTEQPGAADRELAQLRAVPRTVSADAQVYTSADGSVRLTRMTWLSRFDVAPTRGAIESME